MTTPELRYLYLSRLQVHPEHPPIEYLNIGGGEMLWLSQGMQPYVFSLGDMYSAVTRATTVVMSPRQPLIISLSAQVAESEPETENEFIDHFGLRLELDRVAAIAREVLGPKTQISYRLRTTRDTGTQQLVVEIRFRKSKDSKARLKEFLQRYTAEIPTEVQQRITLLRLPA